MSQISNEVVLFTCNNPFVSRIGSEKYRFFAPLEPRSLSNLCNKNIDV